ncbi:MAG: hypothetical protein V1776_01725 [Candidatus Diapherotrites archaeon]
MDNNDAVKVVWVILFLFGVYYAVMGIIQFSEETNSLDNPNKTVFISTDSLLVNIFGGILIILGSLLGSDFSKVSEKLFGKNKNLKVIVIAVLLLLGFYLATLQPTGVMLGRLH